MSRRERRPSYKPDVIIKIIRLGLRKSTAHSQQPLNPRPCTHGATTGAEPSFLYKGCQEVDSPLAALSPDSVFPKHEPLVRFPGWFGGGATCGCRIALISGEEVFRRCAQPLSPVGNGREGVGASRCI
jgi:hypothetical protein